MKKICFEKIKYRQLIFLSDIIRNTLFDSGYTIKESEEYDIDGKQYGKINYFLKYMKKRLFRKELVEIEHNAVFEYINEIKSYNATLDIKLLPSEQAITLRRELTTYINKYESANEIKIICPFRKINETQNQKHVLHPTYQQTIPESNS